MKLHAICCPPQTNTDEGHLGSYKRSGCTIERAHHPHIGRGNGTHLVQTDRSLRVPAEQTESVQVMCEKVAKQTNAWRKSPTTEESLFFFIIIFIIILKTTNSLRSNQPRNQLIGRDKKLQEEVAQVQCEAIATSCQHTLQDPLYEYLSVNWGQSEEKRTQSPKCQKKLRCGVLRFSFENVNWRQVQVFGTVSAQV